MNIEYVFDKSWYINGFLEYNSLKTMKIRKQLTDTYFIIFFWFIVILATDT